MVHAAPTGYRTLSPTIFTTLTSDTQRLQDGLHVSSELQKETGGVFLKSITNAESLLNAIGMLTCSEQYRLGTEAITKLKTGSYLAKPHDNVQLWPSFFSGIEVISNRITPLHRDAQAAPPVYDFLVSAGTHEEAWLDLPDVNARAIYRPCTVVAVCGKVLRHGVMGWKGGERICLAHFIRDNVHNRLQLPRPDWVSNDQYLACMDDAFKIRQGLRAK
jgi:hypothetical protein